MGGIVTIVGMVIVGVYKSAFGDTSIGDVKIPDTGSTQKYVIDVTS
jgi:hypothetical protein